MEAVDYPGEDHPPRDLRTKYKYNPFCRLFFCWIDPLIWLGFRKPLEHSDLYVYPQECDSRYLLQKFNRYWSQELSHSGSPSLLRVVLKCLWWRMLVHGLLNFIEVCGLMCSSILVGLLSDYFIIESPSYIETRNAYLYALGISLLSLLAVILHGIGFHLAFYLGMLARVMLSNAVHQKILRISHVTVNKVTVGHIVNLASNDLHRLDQGLFFYNFFWIAPLQLIALTYLIFLQIGYTAFLATGLILFLVPIQLALMGFYRKLRFKAARVTDKRIKIMNEVITGIRVIKMYAWEYPFSDLVAAIRKSEVWLVIKASLIRALTLAYQSITIPFISFIVFSVYVAVTPPNDHGEPLLTPQKVFTTLTLLGFARFHSITFVVQGFLFTSGASIAFKRIKDFLLLDDLQIVIKDVTDSNTKDYEDKDSIPLSSVAHEDGSMELCVDNVTASWSMEPDNPVLEGVSFAMDKSNSLLAVVGKVGAGKSTLLQCLLQELPCLSGTVTLKGTIGYASQEAWIFSATLRENVTFGLPYQSDWYNQVIECCALDKDIDMLPDGDLTLVGERGVTLSGGQKVRVNLARAVYRNADICLLDDPLSAVDAVVSRHIFDRCIRGLLLSKYVVLATHQLQYVQQCDSVLALNEGRVTVYGNPHDVLSSDGDIGELMEFLKQKEKEDDDPRNAYSVGKQSILPSTTESSLELPNKEEQEEPHLPMTSTSLNSIVEYDEEIEEIDPLSILPVPLDTISLCSMYSYKDSYMKDKTMGDDDTIHKNSDTKVVPAEERGQGVISLKTYYEYFKAGASIPVVFLLMALFFIGEGNLVATDWWISDWATCPGNTSNLSSTCLLDDNERIGIYGTLAFGMVILVIVRYSLFFVLVLNSSRNLHNKMFATVTRTPILFFDTNPIGRILNRFSKDVGFLDDLLPFIFCNFMLLIFRTMAIVITVLVGNPITIIVLVFSLVLLLLLRWYYLKCARDIKRLEALARSPVYSHISLSLQGLSTIRSYSMQSESMAQFHDYLDQHSRAWYAYLVSIRWFGIRIDMISALYISLVAFLSVAVAHLFDNPALVSLGLSYAIQLNGLFQICIRQSAEVESLMVSAERVMAYGKLNPEASLETEPSASKPSNSWPSHGQIEFEDLIYCHSTDGPAVLKGLTCTIRQGEKVGIVGRTGAGKSSLIASLFRMAEPSGIIKIDDINICSIGLHDIRSKLSIIPQDPVLFGGSIRYNLDPFDLFDDDALWKALDQVQLKEVVQSHDGLLDGEIHEGGGNFSVGQRQLFCLAKALLRNNKILILDEATANVDLETDGIIQQVIRDQFSECTVLIVAHRLDTVMDSDRIMVLRAGLLCEFDEPHILLSNPPSYLNRLVDHTGVTAGNRLREMAANAYTKRRKTSTI